VAEVVLKEISKRWDNFTAVHPFSMEIPNGEFLVLVGPSGCGKSTTLRMIAGLEDPTEGQVFIGGRDVTELEPKNRDIAMVFQSYALYPHMDVFENLGFGLKLKKLPKDAIEKEVRDVAALLGIEGLLHRQPKALSGGQRQRVALGRAIVRKPAVFLMDEPLSNLDAKLRVVMRAELIKLHQKLASTFIYVTHDQTEAMTMGTRIVVMKDGYIQQVGPSSEIYNHPVNNFVAGFIGSPPMNFIAGVVTGGGDAARFVNPGFSIALPPHLRGVAEGGNERRVTLGIRPEHMSFARARAGTPGAFLCEVVEHIGSTNIIYASHVDCGEVVLSISGRLEAPSPGDHITLSGEQDCVHLFDPETEQSLAPDAS
jgi:multiple sugar transport system ATP-binding protein